MSRDLISGFTLGNYSFGVVNLTKNANTDKYGYNVYGIGLDACSQFLLQDDSWGKNVIIFVVVNSSSVHVYNKKKDILVLGGGSTEGLYDTTITAEARYSINFTESRKIFVLSLHYNGSNSFLFVNAKKFINSKQKI